MGRLFEFLLLIIGIPIMLVMVIGVLWALAFAASLIGAVLIAILSLL